MYRRHLAGSAAGALCILLAVTATVPAADAQTRPATSGPAENGSPAWRLKGSFPDPTGRTLVDAQGNVRVISSAEAAALAPPVPADAEPLPRVPGCTRSPVCGNRAPGAPARGAMMRVLWDQMPGYSYTYPYVLPAGTGGVPAVTLDSRGNLWVFQRKPRGMPQLFKYDSNYNLILTVGQDVLPYQVKAHGLAVDADDNVWVLDTTAATATKISPDGRILQTIGVRGQRGDWDESKGQRLLWEPVMIAFAPNGDMYIAGGHGNESPNDAGLDDPANNIGAARILHLDRNGNYINQWYGNYVGQGKFLNAHAIGIDPTSGDVWIGDREDYRIVIYNSRGEFLRTIQTRNLVCAIHFDPQGNPWMASGQDGQFLKLDRDGKVVGAIGNGMGIGPGEFTEASYWVFDRQGNLYAGDTSVARVTKIVAPGR